MRTGTGAPAGIFVGRERDLDELSSALVQGADGRGRLVLIAGEAGIGKTRLAEEAVARSAEHGYRVVRAGCHEDEGAPPFWLWIQVLRSLIPIGAADADRLCGPHRAQVARLLPELAREGDPELVLDSSEARFRLFDALTRVLRTCTADGPLLLVLDDLHWADHASLAMLRFCAREIRDARIVVVGAYRDTELSAAGGSGGSPLGELIGDLRRLSESIALSGLGHDEVGRLVAQWRADAPRLVRAVADETGGNPFFVKEVIRLLAAQGRLDDDVDLVSVPVLPETVRDVIEHHVARLSQPCHDVLEIGAALGHEFRISLLDELSDFDTERIVALVGEALSARVLVEVPTAPGTFRFAHALIREAVYEGLGPIRMRRMHQRIALALEQVFARSMDEHAGLLAHHFLRAAPLGQPTKAVYHASKAGEMATRSAAYEQAASHYRDALGVLELGPQDAERRCELLVALGDALWRSGDADAARVTFFSAAEAAKAIGAGELLARAALGYGAGVGGQGFTFEADETLIGLLEAALRSIDRSMDDVRAQLLARLAVQLYWTGELDRGKELSLSAIDIAERISDPRILLEALYSRLSETDLPLTEERARAEKLVGRASDGSDLELLFWAHQYRMTILAELGETADVDAAIDTCSRIADELGMPRYRWQVTSWRLGRALMAADLERAERLAGASIAITSEFQSDTALFVHASQLGTLRWEQGRFDELEPMIAALAQQYPWITATRSTLALMYADAGRLQDAKVIFERLAAGDFAEVRRNPAWIVAVWCLALPCYLERDAARAETLYDMLAPYADRDIVMGGMVVSMGSTKLPLGLLQAAMGNHDEGARLLREAVDRNAATGNECMRVFALRELAAVLLDAGERDAAMPHLDEALELIDAFGLRGLETRARSLQDGGSDVPAVVEADAFGREGETWALTFRGTTVRLRDVKGLGDIAILLAAPGRDVHVSELVAVSEGSDAGAVAAVLHRPADELIDAQAREAYRRRISELQQELDDARDASDLVRAERAKDDLDALTDELAGAYGLGGRPRTAGSDVERARKAVGWRIRDAIRRVEAVHPALATYLRESLQLGTLCTYRPGSHPGWTVTT